MNYPFPSPRPELCKNPAFKPLFSRSVCSSLCAALCPSGIMEGAVRMGPRHGRRGRSWGAKAPLLRSGGVARSSGQEEAGSSPERGGQTGWAWAPLHTMLLTPPPCSPPPAPGPLPGPCWDRALGLRETLKAPDAVPGGRSFNASSPGPLGPQGRVLRFSCECEGPRPRVRDWLFPATSRALTTARTGCSQPLPCITRGRGRGGAPDSRAQLLPTSQALHRPAGLRPHPPLHGGRQGHAHLTVQGRTCPGLPGGVYSKRMSQLANGGQWS